MKLAAVGDAEQSVTYADRSGDADWPRLSRTTHADALHQAGRRAEAETRFREAEQMQAERQPAYPLLYSQQGFRYCDLLLAAPERAAWQLTLRSAAVSERPAAAASPGQQASNVSSRVSASGPAAGGPADTPALQSLEDARRELDAAVAGLRRAGQQQYLPLGLLTRAWLRFLTGARTGPGSAQEDLDEAWEIAARGPMKLHMADIHLYRARLFGSQKPEVRIQNEDGKYPWESPAADLAAAGKLIHACGYHRRDEELADARKALGL